jgi:hypothetical protein
MFKLYSRLGDRRLLYREAWVAGTRIVEHWGECGDRGQTKEHSYSGSTLQRLEQEARAAGYHPIPDDEMAMLIVEYLIDGFGSSADLDRRHALEDEFNELVGWLGLGHLDGGSIGSGAMEVALMVVDFDIAKEANEKATALTTMAGFNRIYRME